MKRILFFCVTCAILMVSNACDDFFTSSSKDLIIPDAATHYFEILRGEIIITNSPMEPYVVMTDEIEDAYSGEYFDTYREASWFTWQDDLEMKADGGVLDDACWLTYYHHVLVCNTILDQVGQGKVKGEEGEIGLLRAECHFFRAQAYFQLVNLYAHPYENEEQAKTEWGVPINLLAASQDVRYQRSKLAEVYQVIIDDIKKSVELFGQHQGSRLQTIFRPSYAAANLLAGRIFLYTKDYAEAKNYTEEALRSTTAELWDLNGVTKAKYIGLQNTGIIYNYGGVYVSYPSFYQCWKISDELYQASSTKNDLRKDFFYNTYGQVSFLKAWQSEIRANAFRVEELYLNLAECLIAENDWQGAIDEVNRIRKKRFATGTDYEVTARNKEEALELVKNERFVELSLEEHRWFDLRRWGRPRLTHVFLSKSQKRVEFVLEENSPNYTFPVPKKVLEVNPTMIRLERQGQRDIPY